MALPTGWPGRLPTGTRTLRFYKANTTTALFADNAYLFVDLAGANPYTPTPVVPPGSTAPVAFGSPPYGSGLASSPDGFAPPKAQIYSEHLRIFNDGSADLEFSFDGTVVHGVVKGGTNLSYEKRYECGIAVRAASATAFRIEAW